MKFILLSQTIEIRIIVFLVSIIKWNTGEFDLFKFPKIAQIG